MEIQNLDVNDLIERNEVELNEQLIEHHLKNKNILITGAGGSIGSEISLKIARLKPNKLINIDFSEYNLYKLKNNLDSLDIKEKKIHSFRCFQYKRDRKNYQKRKYRNYLSCSSL